MDHNRKWHNKPIKNLIQKNPRLCGYVSPPFVQRTFRFWGCSFFVWLLFPENLRTSSVNSRLRIEHQRSLRGPVGRFAAYWSVFVISTQPRRVSLIVTYSFKKHLNEKKYHKIKTSNRLIHSKFQRIIKRIEEKSIWHSLWSEALFKTTRY